MDNPMSLPNPLDLLIAPAYAQAAATPQAPSLLSTFAFPVILLVIMYFLMIRPQMKRTKEHRAMLDKLAVGDEVITNGGIAGTVRAMGDSFLTIEIADRVEIRVQRAAIGNVLPRGTLKSA
jgi:preprotein translocase subunit YajC